ncbi:AAA-like domain-containing protein [Leptolyngbya ohadii]|uniref:AAA-like domain-containing protein n=1 Tax=Leptolyngbya ohadii TaxID=1962290 RepID=UPI000B59F4FD|nr:AAA-like domain-containing protein [Leptolyngbya ohadii]
MNAYTYQVGGSLPADASSYVTRQADGKFYQKLIEGEFCYVLNSRQMGKSSLRVRAEERLRAEGVACATIDITSIGTAGITPEQWYFGVIELLVNSFSLYDCFDSYEWWEENKLLSPVQKFSKFLKQILLQQVTQSIVIFVDEIDSVLSLPFNIDDFFAVIRDCYNNRADQPEFRRLTFALIGVATPSDLIRDKRRTPFNIGQAIELTGFSVQEAKPLLPGLASRAENPPALLCEIIHWTGGQPFLTQKVCQLVMKFASPIAAGTESESIANLLQSEVIDRWEAQDEPEHLKTIRNRILQSSTQRTGRLLGLYQQVLQQGGITADDTPEQMELRLSGLVVRREGKLQVYNPIYAAVFNLAWVSQALANLRPYAQTFSAWVDSGFTDKSRLLRGQALTDAQAWAKGKGLSELDDEFLRASIDEERRIEREANEILRQAQQRAEQEKWAAEQEKRSAEQARHKAEQEKRAADQARSKAEQEKQKANRAQQKAEQAKYKAEQERAAANRQTAIAERRKREADRNTKRAKLLNLIALILLILATLAAFGAFFDSRLNNAVAQSNGAVTQLLSKRPFAALEQALGAGQNLRNIRFFAWNQPQKQEQVTEAIQRATFNIAERNRFSHQFPLYRIGLSPDGRTIATGSTGGAISIQSIDGEFAQRWKVKHPNATINSIQFNPRFPQFATAADDGRIKLWNLKGEELPEFKQQEQSKEAIYSLSISPDGSLIASGGTDKVIRIWTNRGQLIRSINAGGTFLIYLAFSADGKQLLSAGDGNDVKLWNVADGSPVNWFAPEPASITAITQSPNGKWLAFARSDDTASDFSITLWNLECYQLTRQVCQSNPLRGHQGTVNRIRFSPDSRNLVSVSADGTAKLWNLDGSLLETFTGHQGAVTDVAYSPEGQRIITVGQDSNVIFWDFRGKQLKIIPAHQKTIRSSRFRFDNQRLITASEDGQVKIWDTAGNLINTLKGNQVPVYSVDINAQNFVVSGGADRTIQMWNPQGDKVRQFPMQGAVWSVRFSPDGQSIVSGDQTGAVQIQSVTDSSPPRAIAKHDTPIRSVRFSPADGNMVASASADGIIKLSNLKGDLIDTLVPTDEDGNLDAVNNINFSSDGTLIASASSGGRVRIWNIRTRKEIIKPLKASGLGLESVNFTPDGQLVVAGDRLGLLTFWNLDGKKLTTLHEHQQTIHSISFSSDGKTMLSTGADRSIFLWNLEQFHNWGLDESMRVGCDWMREARQSTSAVAKRLANQSTCRGF